MILQLSEEAYHQELSAMQQERLAEKQEEAYHQELSAMRQEKCPKNPKENNSSKEDQLSRDWVLDNFRLRDNPIMKENSEDGKELIQVLQGKGRAFEGGALRDKVIGQGVAGRTDWIVAHV